MNFSFASSMLFMLEMSFFMIYVVGSGPSGVSCSHALLAKGLQVTMLDAGIELEPDKQEAIKSLSNSSDWDPSLLAKLRGNLDALSKDGPLKLSYCSDFPYREVKKHIPIEEKNV